VNPKKKKSGGRQIPLLVALTEEEQALMNLLEQRKSVHVDEICQILQLPVSKVSTLLLQLEFSNLVRSRPGKCYELV
jgi:DNA processing protein